MCVVAVLVAVTAVRGVVSVTSTVAAAWGFNGAVGVRYPLPPVVPRRAWLIVDLWSLILL